MEYLSLYDEALARFTTKVKQTKVKDGDAESERQLNDFLRQRGDPQAARESAQVLKKNTSSKYGSKMIGNKVVIPEKWITNIMGNIDNAIAVGNKLVSGAPETVSAAWFVVKLGLGAIQQNYELYSLFGAGLTAMTEVMVLIPHYDTIFDKRSKAGFKIDDMTQKLFSDIVECYAAILDFLFSIKRHVEAGVGGKVRHAIKDILGGGQSAKFKEKQDAVLELKRKVLEDSDAAFKSKLFDQMGDVQESLKATLVDISSFNVAAKELAQGQSDILHYLERMEESMKPKSRWDILKQEFDKHVKTLSPYEASADVVKALLEEKQEGTGDWLAKNETVREWQELHLAQLLCLTGAEGVGKSIVGASIFERLTTDPGSEGNQFYYLSCTTSENDLAEFGQDPAQKIRQTIIYQLYKTLTDEEQNDDPNLLEEANKLFHQPKKTEKQKNVVGLGPGVSMPPFIPTTFKLLDLVKTDFCLVIDGLDRLSEKDQLSLFEDFADLVDEREHRCRIVAICRTGHPFASKAETHCPVISVEENNHEDIAAVLEKSLQSQVGFTKQERTEAKAKVVKMAAGSFAYVTDIAIPFLEQPFQRPLSKRLEAMPGGILDTYRQALKSLSPAYVDLLRTAILWTIYAPEPVRIREIMDAHSGIYLADIDVGADEGFEEWRASELEIDQLKAASGPFLRTWPERGIRSHVSPKDIEQLRKFCQTTTDAGLQHDHPLCSNCPKGLSDENDFRLSEKQAHLSMCIILLKHLNSPLFQKRYGLSPKPIQENTDEPTSIESEQHGPQQDLYKVLWRFNTAQWMAICEKQLAAGMPSDEETYNETANGSTDDVTVASTIETLDAETEDSLVEPAEGTTEAETLDVGSMSDSSYDGDDEEASIMMRRQEKLAEERQNEQLNRPPLRYEIEQMSFHLLMAEKLWIREEKEQSEEWQELITLLDIFALDTPEVFQAWCRAWECSKTLKYRYNFRGYSPLNVAAYIGASYWCEHLVRDKGFDPNTVTGGYTALQALGRGPVGRPMLKFLLKQPGLDLDIVNGNEKFDKPVMHLWLKDDGCPETIQAFLDHNAAMGRVVDGRNALHWLSYSIQDPEALSLTLTAPNPPDINLGDAYGDTPLHCLLSSADITPSLVEAYLSHGADINAENKNSIMPLDMACWNCEPEISLVLLKHGVKDIDDRDSTGYTALHSGATNGDLETVKALLDYGADIEARNNRGKTCLDVACLENQPRVVEELILRRADVLTKDSHDRGPMFWSCYENNTPDVAHIVLDALKDKRASIQEINRTSKNGRTPLRMAAAHGFVGIVKELLDMTEAAGLSASEALDVQDKFRGNTALHRAAARGEVETVKLLLERGATASLVNKNGKSALQIASALWQSLCETKFEEVVLLCIPADVHHANDPELPAIAAANGSVRVLEALAQAGVHLNEVDSFGWTPLLLAQRLQLPEVERFLRSHQAWKTNLPTAWITHVDVSDDVTISDDGLSITYTGGPWNSLTTDRPLPGNLDNFYYELTLTSPDEELYRARPRFALGFSTLSGRAYEAPGWQAKTLVQNGRSWALHADTGIAWWWSGHDLECRGRRLISLEEGFGPGDTVGAGVDLDTQSVWFTKNGKKFHWEIYDVNGRLFPIVGIQSPVCLETNFGAKPFMWDGKTVLSDSSDDESDADSDASSDITRDDTESTKLGATEKDSKV